MPYDSELNRLESKLVELEEEIKAINSCKWNIEYSLDDYDANARLVVLNRTLARLTDLKELAEMKVKVHKERVKESGVKY